MEKLLGWLASLFKVDVVWVEKGHGQWVKRRNFHPVAKAAALLCVLFLLFGGIRSFFRVSEPEAVERLERKVFADKRLAAKRGVHPFAPLVVLLNAFSEV